MLIDAIGYFASSLVFATFCAQAMLSLRSLAIASNLAFIGYAYIDSLWPILILHCAMLPINVLRGAQLMRKSCPEGSDISGEPAAREQTRPRGQRWLSGVTVAVRTRTAETETCQAGHATTKCLLLRRTIDPAIGKPVARGTIKHPEIETNVTKREAA